MNNQQKETFDYFKKRAKEWEKKASIASKKKVNVIKQRNDFVIEVVKKNKNIGSFLDVGCGTGDLVKNISLMCINSIRIDIV